VPAFRNHNRNPARNPFGRGFVSLRILVSACGVRQDRPISLLPPPQPLCCLRYLLLKSRLVNAARPGSGSLNRRQLRQRRLSCHRHPLRGLRSSTCNSFSHRPTAAVQTLVCARRHTFVLTLRPRAGCPAIGPSAPVALGSECQSLGGGRGPSTHLVTSGHHFGEKLSPFQIRDLKPTMRLRANCSRRQPWLRAETLIAILTDCQPRAYGFCHKL
jgi:hypothetical protein